LIAKAVAHQAKATFIRMSGSELVHKFIGEGAQLVRELFELAQGGTLFLDDIDDVPQSIQPKLLRAIESREVMRIGGTETTPIDVRLIAATNKDLRAEVGDGRFREDLFYRLNVVSIHLPWRGKQGLRVVNILESEGVDAKKIIVTRLDSTDGSAGYAISFIRGKGSSTVTRQGVSVLTEVTFVHGNVRTIQSYESRFQQPARH
jgi:hypothetical protein